MFLEYILILTMAAVFGMVFGSFVNVVAIRTHEHSTLMGRSKCMYCHAMLKPRHLVPILSYLIQRGKCATCGKKISVQYPMVELAGALLAIITVARYLPEVAWLSMGFEFFFGASLLVFTVMDFKWSELPLELMVGTGLVFSLWNALLKVAAGASPWEVGWSHVFGLSVAALFFLFQWLVSRKRWIGSGDIWLGAIMGAVLGWPLVGLAVYFAYLMGGAFALFLLLAKKIQPGTRVPFGPALVAGTLVAMWWGQGILQWLTHAVS